MLKGSILVSFILKILNGLNKWYEFSLVGRCMKTLGRVFTKLLQGSFLNRLVERDFEGSVFARVLSFLTGGIKKGQEGLAKSLGGSLQNSLLYAYMTGFTSFQKGLMSFGFSLAGFGLVLSLKKPSKLHLGLVVLGIFLGLLSRILKFYPPSQVARLLSWMKGFVYEEEGHDCDQ